MGKRVVLSAVIGLIIGGLGVLVYFYSVYSRVVVTPIMASVSIVPEAPTPTPDPLAPINILILGYGGGSHEGGYLTDTIIVAHIDPRNTKVTLISIPRDLWVQLPLQQSSTVPYKINAAYAWGRDKSSYPDRPIEYTGNAGGGQLAKYAVSQVLGMPIDYFISLSFDGFVQSIDTLGGIEVDVPHAFEDKLYPIEEEKDTICDKSEEDIEALTATLSGELLEREFLCRFEELHFEKGKEQMDGARALKFVRSRRSETYGGDYNRSLRQLALLSAVKKKVISVGMIPRIIPFISSLTNDMQTDITAAVVSEKLSLYKDPEVFTMQTIGLTSDNVLEEAISIDGQYILVSIDGEGKWESVHRYIREKLLPEPEVQE